MALDLTLCLVPTQFEALFLKAANNPDYAKWIHAIPSILKDPNYIGYQNTGISQFKRDIAALTASYQFTDEYYFYDSYRCFSTIDYLINEHIKTNNLSIQPSLLWEGGNKFPNVKAGQGIPIQLYGEVHIEKIFLLLVDLEFIDLLRHYDYERMQEDGIYKLTRPENLEILEETFNQIKDIFLLALAKDLAILKIID